MTRRLAFLALFLGLPGLTWAQAPLALPEAITRAQAANPDARAAEVAERLAAARPAASAASTAP